MSGIATPSSFSGSLPRSTACTVNNALFELLLCGFEVGTRIHVLLGAYEYDESANARVWAGGWVYALGSVRDEDMLAVVK